MKQIDFLDACSRIAQLHPNSKDINSENDICIRSGINSFSSAKEYRDQYIIISSAIFDRALFVEAQHPFNKILALIDGQGTLIILDNDYRYLSEYIRAINSQIV